MPSGVLTFRIGSPVLRNRVPEWTLGRKPLLQQAAPPLIPLPVLITTNAGRSRVSAPSPYVIQDPMLGRPGCENPVFM
jgi:hypothetical protein